MSGFFPGLFKRKRPTGKKLDPSIAIPPMAKNQIGLEAVIGDDDRLTVKDVTVAPWRPLVCLQIDVGSKTGIGTGVLIAPRIVLTAAHNLYLIESGTFPKAISAHAGVVDGNGPAESRVVRVETCPGYTSITNPNDPKQYLYDYGIAYLADDALHTWAQKTFDVPKQAPLGDDELKRATLTVSGYPDEKGKPIVLKFHAGKPDPGRLAQLTLGYQMDSTAGQSGGPVFRYHPDTQAVFFAGVHVAGDTTSNTARRYDAGMRKQIETWLAGAGVA